MLGTKTQLMESLGATLLTTLGAGLGMAKPLATLGAAQLMLEGATQLLLMLEGAELELPHCVGASLAVDDLIGLAAGAEIKLAVGASLAVDDVLGLAVGATARRLRSTKRLTCASQHLSEFLLRTGHV